MTMVERAREALTSYRLEHVSSAEIAVVLRSIRNMPLSMLPLVDHMDDDKYVARGRAIDVWYTWIDAALAEAGEGR